METKMDSQMNLSTAAFEDLNVPIFADTLVFLGTDAVQEIIALTNSRAFSFSYSPWDEAWSQMPREILPGTPCRGISEGRIHFHGGTAFELLPQICSWKNEGVIPTWLTSSPFYLQFSTTSGWGLVSNTEFKKGDRVAEYLGNTKSIHAINNEEAKRCNWKFETNCHLLGTSPTKCIDGSDGRGVGWAITHSPTPSVEWRKGRAGWWAVALTDLIPGTLLTCDMGADYTKYDNPVEIAWVQCETPNPVLQRASLRESTPHSSYYIRDWCLQLNAEERPSIVAPTSSRDYGTKRAKHAETLDVPFKPAKRVVPTTAGFFIEYQDGTTLTHGTHPTHFRPDGIFVGSPKKVPCGANLVVPSGKELVFRVHTRWDWTGPDPLPWCFSRDSFVTFLPHVGPVYLEGEHYVLENGSIVHLGPEIYISKNKSVSVEPETGLYYHPVYLTGRPLIKI